MFLSPSDPGIVPLGQVNKNAAGATGKSRSPSRKANSRKMMLKDLSEAVRDMLNDSGYIFSEEYEVCTPYHYTEKLLLNVWSNSSSKMTPSKLWK